MRQRAGPPQESGAEPQAGVYRSAVAPKNAANKPSERALDIVQPLEMRVEDPAREPLVEPKRALAVGQAGLDLPRRVERRRQLGDLAAQRLQTGEQNPPIGVLGGQHADDRLVLDAREAGERRQPLLERPAALVGQRVV